MVLGCAHTIHARHHHRGWNRENRPNLIVAPGETIEVEVHDTSGGQITPRTSAGDLPNMDYSRFTPLTGPIAVDGAMPGDGTEERLVGKACVGTCRSRGWLCHYKKKNINI